MELGPNSLARYWFIRRLREIKSMEQPRTIGEDRLKSFENDSICALVRAHFNKTFVGLLPVKLGRICENSLEVFEGSVRGGHGVLSVQSNE